MILFRERELTFYIMKDLRKNTAGLLLSIPLAANSNIYWVVADKVVFFMAWLLVWQLYAHRKKTLKRTALISVEDTQGFVLL